MNVISNPFRLFSYFFLFPLLCGVLLAEPLKTMAWNLQWYPGGRPNAKESAKADHAMGVKKIFSEQAPDIFLAQELIDKKAFEDLVATVSGMQVHTYSNFPDYSEKGPAAQQIAIASKLKANSAWFELFKPSEALPNLRRGFAFAALEHPEGGLIMVYSVHLKSNRGSHTPEGEKDVAATRAESIRQIVAHKNEMQKKFADKKIRGWVVGGDFNTNHDGQFPVCTAIADLVQAGFHNTWNETPKEKRLTWRTFANRTKFKPTTFDYFLTDGFIQTQATMISGIPMQFSDHAPIVMELKCE
ncbi:MAG: endonuclease/exonuclease/phosphatase family protein [Akkermansiaceae bacterium]